MVAWVAWVAWVAAGSGGRRGWRWVHALPDPHAAPQRPPTDQLRDQALT